LFANQNQNASNPSVYSISSEITENNTKSSSSWQQSLLGPYRKKYRLAAYEVMINTAVSKKKYQHDK